VAGAVFLYELLRQMRHGAHVVAEKSP